MAGAVSKAEVVRQDGLDRAGVREANRGDQVDCVECRHRLRPDGLGRLEQSLFDGYEGDRAEKLFCLVEHSKAQRQALQLDARETAGDVPVEGLQRFENR